VSSDRIGGLRSAKREKNNQQREKRKEGGWGKMAWIVLADSDPPSEKRRYSERRYITGRHQAVEQHAAN